MPYNETTKGSVCPAPDQASANPEPTSERPEPFASSLEDGHSAQTYPSSSECYHPPQRGEMPTFPEWWRWELTFTSHAELRMEQRGVTEVEVRAMLERATGFEPSVVEGRFMILTRRAQRPWIVIVEPDAGVNLLVVVTVYEVSE